MDTPDGTTDPTRGPEIKELAAPDDEKGSTRATKVEVEARLAEVRRWIRTEGIAFEDAIGRLQDRYKIGRRQAVRVWRRGIDPLLSDEDRRRTARPRDRQGRYTMWPSLRDQSDPASGPL